MTLIAERAPDDASVLVLGAGGGLELKAFAEAKSGWRFDGVDPSSAMLDVARNTLGGLASRARLHRGLIDVAPEGPFDAATCILTLHFIEPQERLRTLNEIHHRLKPAAPLVVAHFSIPRGPGELDLWLSRYTAFAGASGVEPAQAHKARIDIAEQLPILSPEEDEQLLRDAGFSGITLFYMGFSFRGWVAHA